MKRVGLAALFVIACNQTPVNTPVRSFDRPTDVALTCVVFNPTAFSNTGDATTDLGFYEPLALSQCGPLSFDQLTKYPFPGGDPTNELQYYTPELRALVANSARGEVALVNVPQEVLIDLDRQNPGYNFIPVGRLPEGIRASADGCLAMTVNTDSCDLSVLNLTTLYNMPFAVNDEPGQYVGLGGRDYSRYVVRQLDLYAGNNLLSARPTAIEMAPTPTSQVTVPSCGDAIEHAWVALPGCQVVVEVAVSLANADGPIKAHIERAIQVTRDGVTVLPDPTQLTCVDECTAGAPSSDPTDPLNVADGGARLPSTQAAPVTIAIDDEDSTQRLVIGDEYGEKVTLFALDPATGEPGQPTQVALEPGALGVQRVRVSPRSPAGKFLYAIARDGTARVIDLDRLVECETNPDPSTLESIPPVDPSTQSRRLGCFPLGDPATPRRSADAIGPGIQLPNGALARDVAFVHLDTPIPPTSGPTLSAQPSLLVGDFAWLASSDGHAQVIQVFDACPQPNDSQQFVTDGPYTPACDLENVAQSRFNSYNFNTGNPLPEELERLSHRIRNGARRFLAPENTGDSVGTARIQDPNNTVTVTVRGSPAKSDPVAGITLPFLESVIRAVPSLLRATTPPAPPNLGYTQVLDFPDPVRSRAETWTLAWEGALPGTNRTFGRVCGYGDASCPRASIVDAGATVCGRDVQVGDKVELLGCTQDSDCTYTQVCAHDPNAPALVTSGLCLDSDTQDQQIAACSAVLRAQRRYRITAPKQDVVLGNGDTTDVLQLAEIYEPEYPSQTITCNVDADCTQVTVAPPDTALGVGQLPTQCLKDSDGIKRCLRGCDPTAIGNAGLCGTGYLCAIANTSTATTQDYRCMRSPLDITLLDTCFPKLQHYQVRAGDAFTVIGSTSGFISDYEPNPVTHVCEEPQMSLERIRLRQPRLPLDAPACPATMTDAISWAGPDSPNTCEFDPTPQDPTMLATGDRILHFENPVLTFALHVPHNPTGYVPDDDTVISFVVVGGGFPLGLQLGIANSTPAQNPKSLVVGPDNQTVFVVDEGKGSAATSLRGQLLRLVSSAQICDPAFQVR